MSPPAFHFGSRRTAELLNNLRNGVEKGLVIGAIREAGTYNMYNFRGYEDSAAYLGAVIQGSSQEETNVKIDSAGCGLG